MLDMLGENARAAVGKVKQLQSKGATPDQIDAQMIEAARNGLLPLSVAFAAQKALQRQNPPAPPPQGTVVSDMLSQLDQRQQGIASLPAPTMDTAQYAGGGIVAFSEAGAVKKKEKRPLTPEEKAELQRLRSIFEDKPMPVGAPGYGSGMSYVPLDKKLLRERFSPRYEELMGIDREWREGEVERNALASAEKMSQQAGLGALPAAPGAPAAAGTEAADKEAGIAALSPEAIKKYSVGVGSGEERSAFAGLRAPKISSTGYDQAAEQAVAQYAPTEDDQKSQDILLNEILARRERLGIGQAAEKRREKLGKKREDIESERKRSKLEEIGLGFLTEGVAAASRGESTLGALASGFGAGLKGAKLSKEKLDAAEDKLDEQEAALDQQREALLLQGDADALRQWEIRQNRLVQNKQKVADIRLSQAAMRLNIDQFNIGNEFKLKLAEVAAAASRSKTEKAADPWLKRAGAAYEAGDNKAGDTYLQVAAKITAAGAAGVQTEALRQAGKAATTAALTGNPAEAGAGTQTTSSGTRYTVEN